MTLSDPVLATRYVLELSPDVSAAMGGSVVVRGSEVPDDLAHDMPQRCIVVKSSGGTSTGVGATDTIGYSVRRVDVWCYGRTPQEAAMVCAAAEYCLKRWRAGSVRRHHIHWFNYSSGPQVFRDPVFDWPTQVVTFEVQLADELTPGAS